MELFDTHTHLMYPDFGDLGEVIKRAKEAGVTQYVVPGLNLETSMQALDLASKYPEILPAIGLHPSSPDEDLIIFKELAADSCTKAIGEVGLDSQAGPIADQETRLRFFLDLAIEVNKPVLLHIRDMWDDAFRILGDYPELCQKAVIHCFTGDKAEAEQLSGLGLFVSVTAIVARSGMGKTLDALRDWPLEAMMLETDGPYLAWPGEKWPNEPKTVAKIAQFVADLKDIPIGEVAEKTTATAKRFFNL